MIRRLSVSAECKDKYTCPAVFTDDADPDHAWVVGVADTPPDGVLVGDGERAVRVPRQVLDDAVATAGAGVGAT